MMRAGWCAWILVPALWAGSVRAAVPPGPHPGVHCAGAGIQAAADGHGRSYAEAELPHPERMHAAAGASVGAQHHCPGCQPGHCPDMAHCITAGSLAAAPHAPAFGLAAPFTSDRASPDDRPLSANPTPPIPPPQLAL